MATFPDQSSLSSTRAIGKDSMEPGGRVPEACDVAKNVIRPECKHGNSLLANAVRFAMALRESACMLHEGFEHTRLAHPIADS